MPWSCRPRGHCREFVQRLTPHVVLDLRLLQGLRTHDLVAAGTLAEPGPRVAGSPPWRAHRDVVQGRPTAAVARSLADVAIILADNQCRVAQFRWRAVPRSSRDWRNAPDHRRGDADLGLAARMTRHVRLVDQMAASNKAAGPQHRPRRAPGSSRRPLLRAPPGCRRHGWSRRRRPARSCRDVAVASSTWTFRSRRSRQSSTHQSETCRRARWLRHSGSRSAENAAARSGPESGRRLQARGAPCAHPLRALESTHSFPESVTNQDSLEPSGRATTSISFSRPLVSYK